MKKTQEQRILAHLKTGRTINPLQALRLFGSFRLASRISALKKAGNRIDKMWAHENGKRFAKYYLIKRGSNEANN